MPELPSVSIYVERLRAYIVGHTLTDIRVASPFVLRTVQPTPKSLVGKKVIDVRRMAKRIVLGFDSDIFVVIHLMVAGRLRWKKTGVAIPKKRGLLAFDFNGGSLLFTEASKKKRASVHIVVGEPALVDFDRGGIEPLGSDRDSFAAAMRSENHTLKRGLTDQHIISGIGNAYSDEILHRAKLSPFVHTQKLSDDDYTSLHRATQEVLTEWVERYRAQVGDGFPDKVTAFHDEMAVHGKYGQPCPVCGAPVQRIVYAENEANYCATCQTGGKVLADRSLSRLLKDNWPRTLEELEERRRK